MNLLSLNLGKYTERSRDEFVTTDGWVAYGEDNLYPQYLVGLYNSSGTHNALVNSISQLVVGEGLTASTPEADAKLKSWSMDTELVKAMLDLKIQGGFALEVQWAMDRKSIARVRHLPFECIRSGQIDVDERVRTYHHSPDWENHRHPENVPTAIRSYHVQDKQDHPTQVVYVKPYAAGSMIYPKPDYIGSINYIELDKAISEYHINNIRNGLSPSFSIHFKNGIPPIEERERIRRDIENQLAGSRNSGKFIITYSDSPERKPDFEPFPVSDVDKQYQFLSEETTSKIMVGHRVVSPAMFGVKTEGQLGSTEELQVASMLFERQVVKPYRKVLGDVLQQLLADSGTPADIEFNGDVPFKQKEEMSAVKPKSDEEVLRHILPKRQEPDPNYTLVDKRKVDYNTDAKIAERMAGIAMLGDNPQPLIKIRYAYEGGLQDNSRDFCRQLVGKGGEYAKEDIESMDNGMGGSVFLFKGGVNCHHHWERLIYLRKDQSTLDESDLKRLLDSLEPADQRENEVDDDDDLVAVKPVDMPNQGRR